MPRGQYDRKPRGEYRKKQAQDVAQRILGIASPFTTQLQDLVRHPTQLAWRTAVAACMADADLVPDLATRTSLRIRVLQLLLPICEPDPIGEADIPIAAPTTDASFDLGVS